MKKVSIYLSPKRLPLSIRKELLGNIKNHMDEFEHLSKMVHVERGRYIGTAPIQRSHDTAIKYAEENGMTVFLGYFVWQYDNEPWQYRMHSFCVDNKDKVVEPSAVPNWKDVRSYYIGIPIPKQQLRGKRHLIHFNSKSFVNEHSPLALFELDYEKEPANENDRPTNRI